MQTATLGFLFKNGKIILAKKKRKIGVGKYNGYGGKINKDEDKKASLVREILEECGAVVQEEKCRELGTIDFIFEDDSESMRVFMYRIDEFAGTGHETEEMGEPREFYLNEIPLQEMMLGDDLFMPYVIEGKKFHGEIYYSEGAKTVIKFNVHGDVTSNELKLK